VNPSAAFAAVLADELIRCGMREAVLAPGSRSAPLALALYDRAAAGQLRLHVRIDERSASFLALGLAKAGGRPAALVCTSGTAAAHFHGAVIEADEACVPLLVLTADRPPELRGTGANQTIDQLKLYGSAVRWFCEVGVPEARAGMVGYWRSLACRAWAIAAGEAGGRVPPGPVHLNVPLREPLVPGAPGETGAAGGAGAGSVGDDAGWPEPLVGRPDGAAWTGFGPSRPAPAGPPAELAWTERGAVVCGDGDYDPVPLLELAETAGWPVLAEPTSGARCGQNALSAYGYLLDAPGFSAAHRPDVIVSAGRPGLSRGQLAFLSGQGGPAPARHVVLAQQPGRWADPARTATQVASAVALAPGPRQPGDPQPGDPQPGAPQPGAASAWLASWRRADAAARAAAEEIFDSADVLTEPALARAVAAALPDGGLLWAASSLPVRDLDQHMDPRAGVRVLASRGASGIDGLVSSAIGAALAHQAAGGGPAVALLGDLAFLHDAPGLLLGTDEPRPDLCLLVVNNDGGGIFSDLEQAALPGPFERLFGTPHGADLGALAAAAQLPYRSLDRLADLLAAVRGQGLRVVEARTDRVAGAALRAALRAACTAAADGTLP
jgi:2-succinyl-5-enolpyruvyl-6-hydroxy-3-cyclohexene-1-carboxylate synthase